MKLLIAILLLIGSSAQAAFVNHSTECTAYAPNDRNIVVTVDPFEDNWTTLGYNLMGSVFDLHVRGCSELQVEGHVLICDGKVLGKLTRVQTDQEQPTFSVELSARHDFTVVGSCKRRSAPLTLIID